MISHIEVDVHMKDIVGRSPLPRSIETKVYLTNCVSLSERVVMLLVVVSDIAQSGFDISPDDHFNTGSDL